MTNKHTTVDCEIKKNHDIKGCSLDEKQFEQQFQEFKKQGLEAHRKYFDWVKQQPVEKRAISETLETTESNNKGKKY